MASLPLPRRHVPAFVPPQKLKRSPRELPETALAGKWTDDDGDEPQDRYEFAALAAYSQPERLSYAGTVDWNLILEAAGIPEWYRPAWRRYLAGAKRRDIPEAHYRWILRACRFDPWRSRLRGAIERLRAVDPLFGESHPIWRNEDERRRTLYHLGWQPIAQGSVSTVCRAVWTSSRGVRKEDDAPGPLTSKHRGGRRQIIVACDGFRANFQGAALEAYRESLESGLRHGSSAVLREYDHVDLTQYRNFVRLPSVGLRTKRISDTGGNTAAAEYQRKGYPFRSTRRSGRIGRRRRFSGKPTAPPTHLRPGTNGSDR